MKYIETGRTRSDAVRKVLVQVDDCDFDYLNQYNWQVNKGHSVFTRINGKHILLHRLLINPPDGYEIDHRDGNRLNNQRANLRLATSAQNKMNRGPRKDCKSGYKGVSWHKQLGKWTARIMINGKYQHIGLFSSKIDAAKAYNKHAEKHFGEFAWLNPL